MAADNRQKIKLMKLYELLRNETDIEHPVSRRELCRRLNEMGISSNVRTLSEDIRVLDENGYEIMSFMERREKFYYVPEMEFSVPEIRILMDAVQAAGFITEKKTAELVEKLAALGGVHSAELLKANMVHFNTRKHKNESVLYNVDRIEEAITGRKRVSFYYFHLNEKAGREYALSPDGEKKRYEVEPLALIFNEDNYYLRGCTVRHPGEPANYRIDRMDHVDIVPDSELSDETAGLINEIVSYTGRAIKMFGGETETVELRFSRKLIDPVFDRFGEDVRMTAVSETDCAAAVQVQISPTFFGWLAQFGDMMRVISPQSVTEKYKEHIGKIV